MRKRQIIILTTVLLLAGVGLYLVWHPRAEPVEPVYGGRRLSDWLPDYNRPVATAEHARAEDAVRHIGTNALPFLLEWLNYKEIAVQSKLRSAYNDVTHTIGVGPFWEERKMERAHQAAKAILTLGPEATPALPILIRMMNDQNAPHRAARATYALSHMGTNAVAPLLKVIMNTNVEAEVRNAAINTLIRVAPEALTNTPPR